MGCTTLQLPAPCMLCNSPCTLHAPLALCNMHAQETPAHCSPYALLMHRVPPACIASPLHSACIASPFILHALHPPCTLHPPGTHCILPAPCKPPALAARPRPAARSRAPCARPPRGRHHARDPTAPSHPPPPRSARPSTAAGRSRAGRGNAHGPRCRTEPFSAPGSVLVRGVCAGWMRFPLPERPPAARRPSPLHLSGRRPWRRHAAGRRRGGPPLRRGEVRAGRNAAGRSGGWGALSAPTAALPLGAASAPRGERRNGSARLHLLPVGS